MTFDTHATEFDERAGLDASAGSAVANALVALASDLSDPVILDIGAGTGSVGSHIAGGPYAYVGLERSAAMLEVFRKKQKSSESHALLVRADCARPWPVGDKSCAVVFAARVVHLLPADQLLRDIRRVLRPGGCFAVGQVERPVDCFQSVFQRYKKARLAEQGMALREGRRVAREVLQDLVHQGARLIDRQAVAHWTRTLTPRQTLAAWEAKPLLSSSASGAVLDSMARSRLIDDLRGWAERTFGELDRSFSFSEQYALDGVRIP